MHQIKTRPRRTIRAIVIVVLLAIVGLLLAAVSDGPQPTSTPGSWILAP